MQKHCLLESHKKKWESDFFFFTIHKLFNICLYLAYLVDAKLNAAWRNAATI